MYLILKLCKGTDKRFIQNAVLILSDMTAVKKQTVLSHVKDILMTVRCKGPTKRENIYFIPHFCKKKNRDGLVLEKEYFFSVFISKIERSHDGDGCLI